MKTKLILSALLLGSTCAGLMAGTPVSDTKTGALKGVDAASMDRSADPRNDFYNYANGGWMKNSKMPDYESKWGAFNELAEKNRELLKQIIEEAAADKSAPKGSIKQKVGDYYSVSMDTLKLEQQGMKPIEGELQKIAALKDYNEVVKQIASMHSRGIGSLFGFGVQQDLKKNDEYIGYLWQGGLGLPDRDYYTKKDSASIAIRAEYRKHIIAMFKLIGKSAIAEDAATKIIAFETSLAEVSMTNVELRDDEKSYHKFSIAELNSMYPASKWDAYFAALGVKEQKNIIVGQPDFFKKVNEIAGKQSLADWKTYLTWNLINESADKLSSAFEKQNFAFYGTVLEGTKVMRPRWKRMIGSTNGALGEAVGQLYVAKAFSPASKARVKAMVDIMMGVYRERIKQLDWMSDSTKTRALEKLGSFTLKLGYPDKWKDYTSLDISRESFFQNYYNAQRYEFIRNLAKLGQPIDRNEWGMSPQTVNAYYNPLMNEIVFPAAIMQPPFFNPEADDAVNYGGIGAVIGHEITHGFDDQGSKFDATGNLKDWWTEQDRERFNAKTAKMVKQFNDIKVFDDLNVNGELTLGENIADLGGLTMSYLAYQKSMQAKDMAVTEIDGLTPEQRFFIGWAQVWRSQYRPEALRQQVLTNPHSPGNIRAIAPPTNMPDFYKAFGVREGDKMYRNEADRVKVW